jgi:hypothetical protein
LGGSSRIHIFLDNPTSRSTTASTFPRVVEFRQGIVVLCTPNQQHSVVDGFTKPFPDHARAMDISTNLAVLRAVGSSLNNHIMDSSSNIQQDRATWRASKWNRMKIRKVTVQYHVPPVSNGGRVRHI